MNSLGGGEVIWQVAKVVLVGIIISGEVELHRGNSVSPFSVLSWFPFFYYPLISSSPTVKATRVSDHGARSCQTERRASSSSAREAWL